MFQAFSDLCSVSSNACTTAVLSLYDTDKNISFDMCIICAAYARKGKAPVYCFVVCVYFVLRSMLLGEANGTKNKHHSDTETMEMKI